jgi:GT2 family glycosyltransferase
LPPITPQPSLDNKALDENSEFQLSSIRRFPHASTLLTKFISFLTSKQLNMYNYFDIDNKKIQYVDSISGSCMMFRKEMFDKLDGFDERFFLYFEDTDFCVRINKLKYDVVYIPSSYIHIKGGSLTNNNIMFVKFHFYLSMFKFIFKYYYEYKMFFIFFILLITIKILL